MAKPNYGIDAPKVIITLLLCSLAGFGAAVYAMLIQVQLPFSLFSFGLIGGCICLAEALLMLLYAKKGKLKHRERMLKLHRWRGHEQVLDVGTGSGLLMIGAARRLITGHSTGIDIWNANDLSNNTRQRALTNAAIESVSEKVNIETDNIVRSSLPDNAFDVVLSNLCLHNIKSADERRKACLEINRILATGGTAIISDFKHTRQYAEVFDSLHMSVEKRGPYLLDTFPPLTIIVARKIV